MFFKNISFRVKIFITIFIAILIPMVAMSTIVYKRAGIAVTKQTSDSVINNVNYLIGNTDSALSAIYEMSNSIITDDSMLSCMNSITRRDHNDIVPMYIELRNYLSDFSSRIKNSYMLNGIDSYYMYFPSQKVMINSKSTYFEKVEERDVDFFRKANMDKLRNQWFVSNPFEVNSLGVNQSRLSKEKLITSSKIVKDENGNMGAILAINVDTNFIGDNFNKVQPGNTVENVLIDQEGNLIFNSDENISNEKSDFYFEINKKIISSNQTSGSFFLSQGKDNNFIIYSISNYTKWRYVVVTPASQVLGQIMEIQKFLFIMISIAVLILLLLTYFLSNIFYKPLEKLVKAMQQLENRNLDTRIDDKRGDEYHKVYNGFNKMVAELKCLMADLTDEKILKKEGDIKLLQAQINPHFLYNTLQSIYSMAKIRKAEEIMLIVSALSKFFRISLSGGKDDVTLKEAVELVVNYLTIQNIRFKGKIDYKIDVPKNVSECIVPKLILQPVVENSIYHGIENKKGKGELNINIRPLQNDLQLIVEDNGIGIQENDLIELRKSIESDNFDEENNFALKNLNRQIKLKYGAEYGIQIESVYGEGTSVYIKLPIIGGRGKE